METSPELELQEALQRFVTQFTDRIIQATEELEQSRRPAVRDQALPKNLYYVAAAIEIATGPIAEINLIDMIVFVRLSSAVLERHWIPELYGDAGASLAAVFARSDEELATLCGQALSSTQLAELDHIIETWLADNPDQVRVEGIRFADFAAAAAGAASERALQARGLLSSVKTVARAANQALVLSQRVLFLCNRMPFLWRLQARLGAREIVADAVTQLSDGPEAPIPRLRAEASHIVRRGVAYVAALGAAAMLLWGIRALLHK
jgi:hypothetical protein